MQVVNNTPACLAASGAQRHVLTFCKPTSFTMHRIHEGLEAAMRYGVLGPVEAKLDETPVAVGGPQ